MLYNYNYDVAALIMGLFLLTVYMVRRTIRTRSNKILFILLVCNVLGSAFDFASTFSISFPNEFTLWYNYLTCYGYLFFYNAMGILFLAYVDSKTKVQSIFKQLKLYLIFITVVELILIITSPFTHLVSYFDINNVYAHGPLMYMLYGLAFIHLFIAAVLFVIKRRRFNRYQVMSLVSFIVVVFLGVLIQILVPSLLVGQFGCTLVLFFIYTSLENPIYHTFRGTTCYNRRAFLEIMKNKLRSKEPVNVLAFVIKDFDNYKSSLDLKNIGRMSSVIAEFFANSYKENAFCIADDKFLVLIDNEKEANEIRENVLKFISEPLELIDSRVKVAMNSTVLINIHRGADLDIIESAIIYILDKEVGTDKHIDFTKTVESIRRRKNISKILNDAIENDLFDVYYQPIKNSKSGDFTCSEALIRLKSQEYGFISPEEFIPIAESDGIIVTIGEMVFDKVCRFIGENNIIDKLGVKYIEINMSPIQCIQPNIVDRFTEIMEKYSVDPTWINLEITETASIEQREQLIQNINRFHDMGIGFSLDDYGSGFASADYLCKLPVDIVKIDKGILWQGMKDINAGIVLIETLRLLKTLNKKIVVEGVEDREMEDLLIDNGCDYLQGYLYSKPITEYEYIEFLRANQLKVSID